MTTRSVSSKIFFYVWNWKDLFSSITSNLQACLRPSVLDTFLPSAEDLGGIALPVLRCSHHNCRESNPSAKSKNAFSQTSKLQGIESFQVAP